MNIKIYPRASRTIDSIAAFVESKNTPGSGKRYANRFRAAIEQLAQPNVQFALCRNVDLAYLKFSCVNYNDRVIVFKIKKDVLTVHRVIHGSLIL